MTKLNLGSYLYPLDGYVNIDVIQWTGEERIIDLNKLPWPFTDGEFQEVRAVDIIEHLGGATKLDIVKEIARITKPKGSVIIRVPCETHVWAWSSLQHAHAFNYNSFEKSYVQPWFDLESVQIQLSDYGRKHSLAWWNRWMCRVGLVGTLTFCLIRNGEQ